MSKEDYAPLVDIIKESGIYVISDEIYSELLFEGEFASLAQFDEIKDQVLIINGFSKSHAMTGWRLGYLLASAPLSSQLTKVHQYVIMSAPTQAQNAAIEALKNGYDAVEAMREQYRQRRNLLCARLNRMGLTTNVPKGTFYVFADIRSTGLSSDAFCTLLLEQQHVAVVPGTAFGEHGEGFVRMSYATSLDQLKEACNRMENFLEWLKEGQLESENPDFA
jgi:aminotransferase